MHNLYSVLPVVKCGSLGQDSSEKTSDGFNGVVEWMMESIGFHNLAILGFIGGPIVIQFAYM